MHKFILSANCYNPKGNQSNTDHFNGLPLVEINDISIVERIIKQAQQIFSNSDIFVITDDTQVSALAKSLGATEVVSENTLADIFEITKFLKNRLKKNDTITYMNCRQPFICCNSIKETINNFNEHKEEDKSISTCFVKMKNYQHIFDNNLVKVINSISSKALFFTRAPLPWKTDKFNYDSIEADIVYSGNHKQHLDIVTTKLSTILKASALESELEKSEKISINRFIENDFNVYCTEVFEESHFLISNHHHYKKAKEHAEFLNE